MVDTLIFADAGFEISNGNCPEVLPRVPKADLPLHGPESLHNRRLSVTEQQILTVPEVALALRCSKAHVHNLINGKVGGTPKLPSIQLGRRRLVRLTSLATWIEAKERGLPPQC